MFQEGWKHTPCLTCIVRRRSLTYTLLNLVSPRYRPTASHCWIPVSERSVLTPWPRHHILHYHKGHRPAGLALTTHLAAAHLCCTVSPHCRGGKKKQKNKEIMQSVTKPNQKECGKTPWWQTPPRQQSKLETQKCCNASGNLPSQPFIVKVKGKGGGAPILNAHLQTS